MISYKSIFSFTVFIAILFLVAYGALAAPVISQVSGAIENGQQAKILGSRFGVKSPAKPYLWAPFEGSANPSSLGVVTRWSASDTMAYAPGEGIVSSGGIKSTNYTASWGMRIDTNFAWNDLNQKMYLHRKEKLSWAITGAQNWKNLRGWSANGLNTFHFSPSNGALVSGLGVAGASSTWMQESRVSSSQGIPNQWRTDEIWMKSNSDNDLADGIVEYYANGNQQKSFVRVAYVPYETYNGTRSWKMRSSGTLDLVQLYPVHQVKAETPGYNTEWYINNRATGWADNIYLDTTWARVMIGDNPVFENCTLREPQIPSAWSSTSITVTINTGEFTPGKQIYFFVVDQDGNPSPGFGPVSLGTDGGSGSSPPPPPPSGVKIIK